MVRLARALYDSGLGPREVLRECYGVEFPAELFVVAEADPDTSRLLVRYSNQPWRLAVPLDRGGPAATPDSMHRVEQEALTRDPNLVPLALCLNMAAGYGGLVLCYALDELAAGRSTVFALDKEITPDSRIARCADSLLAALHTHHKAHADWAEREWRRSVEELDNLVDEEQVGTARLFLQRVEELRRRLVERSDA